MNERPAGSFVLKEDGTLAPNLEDEAMKARQAAEVEKKEVTDNA